MCKFCKAVMKVVSILTAIVGALFVVYFWNLDQKRHLKVFTEDLDLEVINGRYGPYIAYKGKNYRLPKALHQKAAELTYQECMDIVNTSIPTKKK